jgi:hypothetical protein
VFRDILTLDSLGRLRVFSDNVTGSLGTSFAIIGNPTLIA